jgi:hypothetical protein
MVKNIERNIVRERTNLVETWKKWGIYCLDEAKQSSMGLFTSIDKVARSGVYRSSELGSMNWFVCGNKVPSHRMLSVKQLISEIIYYWKGTSFYSPDFSPNDIWLLP